MNKQVIIISGGGHAQMLLDVLSHSKSIRVVGYTDRKPVSAMPAKYLGDDAVLQKFSAKTIYLINAIGSVSQPVFRRKVYDHLISRGFCFLSVIHPSAIVSARAHLADDVQLMPGVVVNGGVRISENVIINTSAILEHDVHVGAHTHVSSGATVCGGVIIGEGVHVGAGATIIQGLTIGAGALIAAGAVVTKNVAAGARVAGVPAKRMSKR